MRTAYSIILRVLSTLVLVLFIVSAGLAGYKSHPWTPRPKEAYPAQLTSEGITIAVDPLLLDSLASQVFDKGDIVTRGIMPLGVVIFNENAFPVSIDSGTIEIIQGDDHLHSLPPGEAVHEIFKGGRNILSPSSMPKATLNPDALSDFEHKSLEKKTVAAHGKGGGFLYLRIPSKDVRGYLANSRVYIPDVWRTDNSTKLIFFEIELKPAVDAISGN